MVGATRPWMEGRSIPVRGAGRGQHQNAEHTEHPARGPRRIEVPAIARRPAESRDLPLPSSMKDGFAPAPVVPASPGPHLLNRIHRLNQPAIPTPSPRNIHIGRCGRASGAGEEEVMAIGSVAPCADTARARSSQTRGRDDLGLLDRVGRPRVRGDRPQERTQASTRRDRATEAHLLGRGLTALSGRRLVRAGTAGTSR